MTAKEILELVEEKGIKVKAFAYGNFDKTPFGKVTEVYQKGGEGEGDHWESVKHFEDHGVYIRTVGFYSSYEGTDFTEGYGEEVKPVEKTVTFYE